MDLQRKSLHDGKLVHAAASQLPDDIWCDVAKLLNDADLHQFRLVCRAWADAANPKTYHVDLMDRHTPGMQADHPFAGLDAVEEALKVFGKVIIRSGASKTLNTVQTDRALMGIHF